MLDLHRSYLQFVTDGLVDLDELKNDISLALSGGDIRIWFEEAWCDHLQGGALQDVQVCLGIEDVRDDAGDYADMKHDQRGTRP